MEYLLAEAAQPGFVRFVENGPDADISALVEHGYLKADAFGASITDAGRARLRHDSN